MFPYAFKCILYYFPISWKSELRLIFADGARLSDFLVIQAQRTLGLFGE